MSEEKFIPISDPKEAVKALNQITEMYNERGLVIKSLQQRIKELEEKLSLYEWKDIKDAPRDGTKFIAAYNDRIYTTYWYTHPYAQGWITDEYDCGNYEFEPTHFMLITPPLTQEGDKE